MDLNSRVVSSYKVTAVWIEYFLASVILVAVLVFGLSSARALIAMDWQQTETFYELIYRVLLLVIGVELARTLVTHDLNAVLNLLAFVVARKTLKPELSVLEIFLSVLAFVALLAASRLVQVMYSPRDAGNGNST